MFKKLSKYLLFRYVVSGGTAAVFDLSLLYVLNSIFGLHYLVAAIFAFLAAFVVSFILQKFWTFQNTSKDNMHAQVTLYLGTSLLGLGLNTFLMYIFVGTIGISVLLSQVFAGALVACCTFFISRHIVFKPQIL